MLVSKKLAIYFNGVSLANKAAFLLIGGSHPIVRSISMSYALFKLILTVELNTPKRYWNVMQEERNVYHWGILASALFLWWHSVHEKTNSFDLPYTLIQLPSFLTLAYGPLRMLEIYKLHGPFEKVDKVLRNQFPYPRTVLPALFVGYIYYSLGANWLSVVAASMTTFFEMCLPKTILLASFEDSVEYRLWGASRATQQDSPRGNCARIVF